VNDGNGLEPRALPELEVITTRTADLSLPVPVPGSPNLAAGWRPGTGQPGRWVKRDSGGRQRGVRHRHSNMRTKSFLDDLSNSGPAVRRYSEGGATSPAEDHFRRRHAAISGYWLPPRQLRPSTQDEAVVEAIHALNREMIAAGVR